MPRASQMTDEQLRAEGERLRERFREANRTGAWLFAQQWLLDPELDAPDTEPDLPTPDLED